MNELYNFYANCLIETRHPERAAPLCELVSMAIDNDYEPALEQIYDLEMDDVTTHIDTLEGWIISCAVGLGHRLGIAFDVDSIYRNPRVALLVLRSVLVDIEAFEDFQEIQAIALSGEPDIFILESMIRYIHGDNFFEIGTCIKLIEPRLMTVINNFLLATSLEDEKRGFDDAANARMVAYIRLYPENPSVWAFQNAAETTAPNVVATSLVFEEHSVPQAKLLEIYAVGLAMYNHDTFDGAYAALEPMLALVNQDELPTMPILQAGLAVLREIYGENDEQATVPEGGV